MAPFVPYVLVGGYAIDSLAVLRILLGLGAIWCYSIFSKRPDSFIHHCEVRRAVFGFLTLAAATELLITALGVESPELIVLRRIGSVGAAVGIFCCSSNWKPLRRVPVIVLFSLLITGVSGIPGTFQVNDINI